MTPDWIEPDWLKRWSSYSPRSVALQSGEDGRSLTYLELYKLSLCQAAVLRERFAIGPGDRVACMALNELEFVSLFFALKRLGAILVPLNFRLTAHEVEHVVRDSGTKLVISQRTFWSAVAGLSVFGVALWSFDGPESLSEVSVCDDAPDIPFCAAFEDPCMILYTSGTTGFPKGAVISHRMLFWNSVNTAMSMGLTPRDVTVNFAPLFHTGGWNVLTTPLLHRGAKVILLRKFDAELLLSLCERERVTVLFGVPTAMDFLRRSSAFPGTDLNSLRFLVVGGEAMPVDLIRVWEERGIPVRQGYGLTEFGPNAFSLKAEDSRRKMGSIGFPNFYVEARVTDQQGVGLPPGEVGELALRGPACMSGYWNNAEATAQTLRDGWLYTGDLVRRDEEGFYYVAGRKKEMFISGGENVYPAEVEKVLRQFEGVKEAAVIGVAHPKWGECGRAFLAFEGAAPDVSALREHCAKRLAKFKVPTEFIYMSELPKTESGKIAKKVLNQAADPVNF